MDSLWSLPSGIFCPLTKAVSKDLFWYSLSKHTLIEVKVIVIAVASEAASVLFINEIKLLIAYIHLF